MATESNSARIARARARLAANLGELQQRLTHARKLVSPRTYLANPWLKVGLGVAVGYLVGRRRPRKRLASPDPDPPIKPDLVHAALRATATYVASALLKRAVARLMSPPATVREAGPTNEVKLPQVPG